VRGSLTIVGLGPARPEHLTLEAAERLQAAQSDGSRVYGLAHAREIVAGVAPDLDVRPLDYLYEVPGVDRPAAYADLAAMLVRRAFADGLDVVYLVAGSPLFINDAVLLIRRTCARDGHPLRIIHGVSFVDLVLDRVFWTGHRGLQLYSAWNVARDGVRPATDAPVLLCQLGEFSSGAEALDDSRSVVLLSDLKERLVELYGEDHRVAVLYSSGRPDYRSRARPLVLSDLDQEPVPVYSNLWIPALGGPEVESEVAPASDGSPEGTS
jgi:uncharacterized protein YabN with tetrapyrrole methylase and pyrophosphatase domain